MLGKTALTVSPIDPNVHYVFALALTKCNATLAVSHTLITYGRERSCPTVQVPHSAVQYTPTSTASTPAHGAIVNVKCNAGYNIRNHHTEQNATCLDQKWIPSLPVCKKIKQCPVLTKPTNGEVSTSGLGEGSKAYYVCHKGFLLNGPKERTCVDEAWDGMVPNCQPLSCPSPPPIDHGSYLPCDYIKHAKTLAQWVIPLKATVSSFNVRTCIDQVTYFMERRIALDGKATGRYLRAVGFVAMESGLVMLTTSAKLLLDLSAWKIGGIRKVANYNFGRIKHGWMPGLLQHQTLSIFPVEVWL